MTEILATVNRPTELLAALEDLIDHLTGVGIAFPGEDAGQWHGTEGLSFNQAYEALAKARPE